VEPSTLPLNLSISHFRLSPRPAKTDYKIALYSAHPCLVYVNNAQMQ